MSYTLTLRCGCRVRVSAVRSGGQVVTRRLETRGAMCRDHRHREGGRLWLWQLLPQIEHVCGWPSEPPLP
jgi:hypothetical protein